MDDIQYGYVGDIVKFDETPDGLMVYGTAASPALDLDAQICDPQWLKTAMPDWFRYGNIREQHSAIAAGVGKELAAEGDKWQLKSLIVDQNTQAKVKAGVLKGYSVGIKGARLVKDASAPNGRITSGTVVEVSLVDRPCNPEATMSIAKAEGANLAPVDVAGVVIHKADDTGCGCCDACTMGKSVEPDEDMIKEAAEDIAAERETALKLINRIDNGLTVKALGVDITKYDEANDIAGALDVIKSIANLIVSEATALAGGRMEEAWDIQTLMSAISSMRQFLGSEQDQSQMDGDNTLPGLTYATLAANPDAVTMPDGSYPITDQHSLDSAAGLAGKSKTYSKGQVQAHVRHAAKKLGLQLPASYEKTIEADSITGNTAEVDKSATADSPLTADVVKTITAQAVAEAVAEANRLSEDRFKAVEAELAKVLATPAPGGPVIIAPPRDQVKSATAGERQRAHYMQMAARTDDPTLRRGFQELAANHKD